MTCIFMDHNKRLDHILLYHIIPLNMHAVIGLVNRCRSLLILSNIARAPRPPRDTLSLSI